MTFMASKHASKDWQQFCHVGTFVNVVAQGLESGDFINLCKDEGGI